MRLDTGGRADGPLPLAPYQQRLGPQGKPLPGKGPPPPMEHDGAEGDREGAHAQHLHEIWLNRQYRNRLETYLCVPVLCGVG